MNLTSTYLVRPRKTNLEKVTEWFKNNEVQFTSLPTNPFPEDNIIIAKLSGEQATNLKLSYDLESFVPVYKANLEITELN